MSQIVKNVTDLHWRYRVIEKLGQGGEGEVYLAEDKLTGQPVVVKFSGQNSGQDLKREFIRLYRMDHPGLLKAFDFYRQDDNYLASFEHFNGVTLDRYLQQNQPGKKELWDIWVKLAGIVAYLHGREYIHGDIKPGNILIGPQGRVKLIDLGLARKTGDERSSGFTGTAEYSAPEVLNGSAGPSQSSDVYSLGLLLFQMMTGQIPAAKDRLDEKQPWSVKLKDYLNDKQSEIGIRTLNYWPQERYHSASQLAQALGQAGYGYSLERPDDFRFSGQSKALTKAVEHLRLGKSGLLNVSAGPGQGKTAFLKELNFIFQIAGQSAAYVNPEVAEAKKILSDIPADTILLVDGLTDEEILGWLKIRTGQSIVVSNQSNPGTTKTDTTITLVKFQKQEYSKVLSGYLAGLSNWELENLSDWVWRQAGSNIAHARAYLEYCQGRAFISQKQDHWQIDWQKMFADQIIPEEIAADIDRRWKNLDTDGWEALKQICLEDGAGSQQAAAVFDPEYWLSDNGRIDGDILRTFIMEQLNPPEMDGIKKNPKQPENPSMARWLFWDKTASRPNWLSEGKGLFKQAQADNDLEKMLYAGRLLVDSGRLETNEQIQMTRQLVALYQRVNRWSKAIELWKTLAESMSGEWEYYQTLAKLYANNGDHTKALEALEEGFQTIQNDDQKCLYLAYKGWVLGVQGRRDDGHKVLNEALEITSSVRCSDGTLFQIYNLLARDHQRSNDFKQVVYWAEKAAGIEIPEVMEKAKLLNILGYSLWQEGNLIKAKTYIETSISLIEQERQNSLLCYALCNLGLISISLKDWGNALLCLQKAENIFSMEDGFALQANIVVNLALVYERLNQIKLSKEKYMQASVVCHGIADITGKAISLANVALQDQKLGKTDYALKVLAHCLSLSQKNGLDFAAAIILKDLGIVNVENNEYREGLDHIEKAMSLVSSKGFKTNWDCLYYGALAAGGLNDHSAMNDYLVRARTQAGDAIEKAQLKLLEGFYMAKNGDLNKGLNLAMEAAGELKDNGDPAESARAWLKTGELALSSDDFIDAEKLMPGLLAAETEFQKMGAPVYLERTRNAILAAIRQLFAPGNIMPGTQMLEGLYQIAALLDPDKNQAELAQSCLDVTVKLLKAERGGLFLLDENAKLFLAAKADLDPDTQNDALEFSSNAVMAAATGETMVVSNDAQLDEALSSRLSVKRNAIRSLLCLPLRSREGTLGAIYLDSRLKSGIFNQAQRDFTKALAQILGAVLESHRLLEELRSKNREHQVTGSKALLGMIGNSAAVKKMIKRIKAAAPTDITVLLDGESGTGKEMAAQIVHQLSARKDKKFLALDCGSLPETLLESELFGYVKGSFTGANKDKTGLFEAADGGTVFLDEIASASPGVQARLLRVIEAGEIRRIGSETVGQVDVRMICATNKDLEIEINEGRFREDLYYRLKVIKIDIPPLRERSEDVLVLAEYFKNKYQKKFNKGSLSFNEGAKRAIVMHNWPGNIRELENTVQKAVLLASKRRITENELEIEGYRVDDAQSIRDNHEGSQRQLIIRSLESAGYNFTKAAKIYGVSKRHFYRLTGKHGVKRDKNVK